MSTNMTFEREGAQALTGPALRVLARELRKLQGHGKSSFASLTRPDGSYVQVAGGGICCLLERRDAGEGRQWRAFLSEPTVPFEDGTELVFGGGRVRLRQDEWLNIDLVVEVFTAFLEGRTLPDSVRWRDLTEPLGL